MELWHTHDHTHSRTLYSNAVANVSSRVKKKELQFHRQRALVWKHFELFKFLMNQKCFHTLTHLFLQHTHMCVWCACVWKLSARVLLFASSFPFPAKKRSSSSGLVSLPPCPRLCAGKTPQNVIELNSIWSETSFLTAVQVLKGLIRLKLLKELGARYPFEAEPRNMAGRTQVTWALLELLFRQ